MPRREGEHMPHRANSNIRRAPPTNRGAHYPTTPLLRQWAMLVVRGKVTEEMDGVALDELMRAHAGVTIDLGAGDGRFAYRYAAAHPDRLVIAIDPVRENLREMSARAARKPERGGM